MQQKVSGVDASDYDTCRCGSKTHRRVTYSGCRLNPNKDSTASAATSTATQHVARGNSTIVVTAKPRKPSPRASSRLMVLHETVANRSDAAAAAAADDDDVDDGADGNDSSDGDDDGDYTEDEDAETDDGGQTDSAARLRMPGGGGGPYQPTLSVQKLAEMAASQAVGIGQWRAKHSKQLVEHLFAVIDGAQSDGADDENENKEEDDFRGRGPAGTGGRRQSIAFPLDSAESSSSSANSDAIISNGHGAHSPPTTLLEEVGTDVRMRSPHSSQPVVVFTDPATAVSFQGVAAAIEAQSAAAGIVVEADLDLLDADGVTAMLADADANANVGEAAEEEDIMAGFEMITALSPAVPPGAFGGGGDGVGGVAARKAPAAVDQPMLAEPNRPAGASAASEAGESKRAGKKQPQEAQAAIDGAANRAPEEDAETTATAAGSAKRVLSRRTVKAPLRFADQTLGTQLKRKHADVQWSAADGVFAPATNGEKRTGKRIPAAIPRSALPARVANTDQHNDVCTVCRLGGDLLCCDGCSFVWHIGCLDPPLKKIPESDWWCRYCVAAEGAGAGATPTAAHAATIRASGRRHGGKCSGRGSTNGGKTRSRSSSNDDGLLGLQHGVNQENVLHPRATAGGPGEYTLVTEAGGTYRAYANGRKRKICSTYPKCLYLSQKKGMCDKHWYRQQLGQDTPEGGTSSDEDDDDAKPFDISSSSRRKDGTASTASEDSKRLDMLQDRLLSLDGTSGSSSSSSSSGGGGDGGGAGGSRSQRRMAVALTRMDPDVRAMVVAQMSDLAKCVTSERRKAKDAETRLLARPPRPSYAGHAADAGVHPQTPTGLPFDAFNSSAASTSAPGTTPLPRPIQEAAYQFPAVLQNGGSAGSRGAAVVAPPLSRDLPSTPAGNAAASASAAVAVTTVGVAATAAASQVHEYGAGERQQEQQRHHHHHYPPPPSPGGSVKFGGASGGNDGNDGNDGRGRSPRTNGAGVANGGGSASEHDRVAYVDHAEASEDCRRVTRRASVLHNVGKVEKLTDRHVVDDRIEYQAVLQPCSGGSSGGGGSGGSTGLQRQLVSGWFTVHALRRLKASGGQSIDGMMQALDAKLGSEINANVMALSNSSGGGKRKHGGGSSGGSSSSGGGGRIAELEAQLEKERRCWKYKELALRAELEAANTSLANLQAQVLSFGSVPQ